MDDQIDDGECSGGAKYLADVSWVGLRRSMTVAERPKAATLRRGVLWLDFFVDEVIE
jgi:hypothetical protein